MSEAMTDQQPQVSPQISLLVPEGTTRVDLSLEELDLILGLVDHYYQTAPRDDLTTTLLLAMKPICRTFLAGVALTRKWDVPRVQRGEDVNLVALHWIARQLLVMASRHCPQLDLSGILAAQAWRRQQQGEAQGEGGPADGQA